MTKDEFQKAVDDVIEDCLRNDYSFGNYARKVTEAVWPVLEAAERERDDVAQQLVQSEQGKRKISEECDALRAKIEVAENDAARQKALAESALRVADGWERKCGELRAKIEAMEKQEPVATVGINAINGNPSVDFVPGHRYLHHNDKLYLAPGAKGE